PLQISLDVPPLPWPKITRRQKIPVGYLLPSGTARVQFRPADGVSVEPRELTVYPQHTASVAIASETQISGPQTVVVSYVVDWDDGIQKDRRGGNVTVLLSPVSLPAYLLRLKWSMLTCLVGGLLLWKAVQRPKMAGVL